MEMKDRKIFHVNFNNNGDSLSDQVSLLMTAAHEIGHSLGLGHSNVRNSLMAPFYRYFGTTMHLVLSAWYFDTTVHLVLGYKHPLGTSVQPSILYSMKFKTERQLSNRGYDPNLELSDDDVRGIQARTYILHFDLPL